MPNNFWIIIAVQFLVYILIAKITKQKLLSFRILLVSFLIGIVIGLPFDLISSNLGLYTYLSDTREGAQYAWNLTPFELIINGFLSFGLAVSTAKFVWKDIPLLLDRKRWGNLVVFFSTIVITSLIFCLTLPRNNLPLMFACGFLIVSIGELLLLFFKKHGPIAELLITWDISKVLKSWIMIMTLALFYEITNLFFPFWVWLPGNSYTMFFMTILMVSVGYVGVIHPMIVFWKLYDSKK